MDYGDSGGFDEEASPEPAVAPWTPPAVPPAAIASASAANPATPAAAAKRTQNSVQSILQSLQGAPPASMQPTLMQPRVEAAHEEAEPAVHVPVQQQARAPPPAPEPTPMARLPSARVSTQVAKRRAEAEQPLMRPPAPDPDQSYEVELITGASSLTYRVLWKGWGTLLDWWERLGGEL